MSGPACAHCGHLESRVVDSRPRENGRITRRRRQCAKCDERWTTYEVPREHFEADASRRLGLVIIGEVFAAIEKTDTDESETVKLFKHILEKKFDIQIDPI